MYKIYLSLLLYSFSFAQVIDFNKALDLTLQNNEELKKEKLNIQLTKLNIQEVQAHSYGKLTFQEQISRTNHSGHVFNTKLSSREVKQTDFMIDSINEPNDRTNFSTKLSYDIPLFTGYKLSSQEDILKLQNKATVLKYKLNKKHLAFEVLKAYNGAVVAKDFIQAVKKAQIAINYVQKAANAFHKDGLVTKIDVKQAKVYKLNVNSKLIEAQNKFDLALAYLRFLTSNKNITDVRNLKNITSNISSKDDLYTISLNNRDELKMLDFQKKAMKKNIKVSDSTYYPTIYSHLEYGFNDDKLSLDFDKDYYMGMIGLDYTLFDKTRDIKKQKSKISYAKTALDLQELKAGIKLELEKALLELKASKKILKEKKEAKNLAQEVFDQSNLMYKNQLIPMTNLLEQEANLRNNETQLIVAKYKKSLALAKLSLVLGLELN